MENKPSLGEYIVESILLGIFIFFTAMLVYFAFNITELGYVETWEKVLGYILIGVGLLCGVYILCVQIKSVKNAYKRYKGE